MAVLALREASSLPCILHTELSMALWIAKEMTFIASTSPCSFAIPEEDRI